METLLSGVGNGALWVGSYCVCNCYHAALSTQNAMMTRTWHIVIFLLYLIAGWLIHSYVPQFYHLLPTDLDICPEETCSLLIINRISLALFVFHLILALVLFGTTRSDQPLSSFQNETWGAKFLLLFILLVGCAFVPEWVFLYYGWISVAGAFLFILIEIVIISDMGHTIIQHMNIKRDYRNSVLGSDTSLSGPGLAHDPNEITASDIAGVVVTLALAMGSIGLIVYSSWLFESLPKCHMNIIIMVLWLVIVISVMFVTFCSKVSRSRQELGALGASAVIFYATFLLWNASVVDDPGQCTAPFVPYGPIYWITTSVGAITALTLIIYSSLIIRVVPYEINTDILANGSSSDPRYLQELNHHPMRPNPQDSYNYSKINFMFALASMYICMLLTNWSVIRRYKDDFSPDVDIVETSLGWISLIGDISAAWILLLVYVYFVCYPYWCPTKVKHHDMV